MGHDDEKAKKKTKPSFSMHPGRLSKTNDWKLKKITLKTWTKKITDHQSLIQSLILDSVLVFLWVLV